MKLLYLVLILVAVALNPLSGLNVDPCVINPDATRCTGVMEKFYFDPSTKTCTKFSYGGCKTNENFFNTYLDCEARCIGGFPYKL
ncbi:Collagen alpha-3(VI) chain [Pseudolycoriella hygida]|uniref:Collagen alpha-3(VI) chain n=1 Tax=Pseudolycoriella hygida TaxID=35572 RepID=A0A9Q0MNP9_9DIPT|nr:Collagen alpha-3(VI) chain [Pseudolycoriella hygida]